MHAYKFKDTVLRRHPVKSSLCLALSAALIAVFSYMLLSMPAQADELTIPGDYKTGYGIENLNDWTDNKLPGLVKKGDKHFQLTFEGNNNGLVTLARLSQNDSLEGYTFEIFETTLIQLGVIYDESNQVISDGSFFGIGCEDYPFKGTLLISSVSSDVPIGFEENSWRYFFNNLSNEAKIVSNPNSNKQMYSSPLPQKTDTFVLCQKITVTNNNVPLDISGFRFGYDNTSGTLVTANGKSALLAGEVNKSDAGTTFSVDLTKSLTRGTYTVKSTGDDAGGIFAAVNENVDVTVTLPDSFNCNTKTFQSPKNAGVLIGSNNGKVTFRNPSDTAVVSFGGGADAPGSAGLIGANELRTSVVIFDNDISVSGASVTGLRAGGIIGTCKGPVSIKNAVIDSCTIQKYDTVDTGRIGGAVGSVDKPGIGSTTGGKLEIAEGCTLNLSNNNLSAPSVSFIGGYAGYLVSYDGDILDRVVITGDKTTIKGSKSDDIIGGYIGRLEVSKSTPTSFSLNLSDQTPVFEFNSISRGTCGGVIGEVVSAREHTVEILGNDNSKITSTADNSANAVVGGITGKVKGYVKTNNLALQNTIVKNIYAADLVGTVADGAVFDVSNITLNEKNSSVLVAGAGKGSVVRFGGSIVDNSNSVSNIVYKQDGSLIYKDTGCEYIGKNAENNDIGNYGQVLSNDRLNSVITLDGTDHTIKLGTNLSADALAVNSIDDFAKLAVTFHTRGKISGVDGIDDTNIANLYTKNITLNTNIDLTKTGIEQLTPSDDITNSYSGTFNGNGNSVTLDIGRNIKGELYGLKYGENNSRKYIGLFASVNGATVTGLGINGNIKTVPVYKPDTELFLGSLSGKATGTIAVENCGISTSITIDNYATSKSNNLYIGGGVGYADTANLSVNGCTIAPVIEDNYVKAPDRIWLGGFCARVNYSGSGDIDFKNNTISTEITKAGDAEDLKLGGFIGTLDCRNYVKADFSGTKADGFNITANGVKNSIGGVLGYTFNKCHVIIGKSGDNSPIYAGTVNAGAASLGGLIYKLDGRMTVNDGFSISGTRLNATGENRGLLLADGTNAFVAVKSEPSGFDGVQADGFDLFVGESVIDTTTVGVAAAGGIVTVETGDALDKLPNSSDWYGLMNTRPNNKTRYYFNIEGNETKNDASETISKPEDLIYWNLLDYATPALPDYVTNEFFRVKDIYNITSNVDIDMTDYCFYPTKKEGVSVNFNGKTLTLGENTPAASSPNNQFYGLQAGLFSDITAYSETENVYISNIKLSGTVANLDVNGSGALICGTVYGRHENTSKYEVKLHVSGVVLSGVRIDNVLDYSPLLINRLGSYSDSAVSAITQDSYTDADVVQKVASSLIGRGGYVENSTPSANVIMKLSNIVLEGERSKTIFEKASLFYDVSYAAGSGSFVYNFNLGEDWNGQEHLKKVTYGAELTLNKDQQHYFDNNYYVRPEAPAPSGIESDKFDFTVNYIPYVYSGYDKSANKTNVNLSVNRKGVDLTEGFGTYQHPYIITMPEQLEYIAKLLTGNNVEFSENWKINFPQGDWSGVTTLDLRDYYTLQARDKKLYKTDTDEELTREVLLQYLSGAYYKLADGAALTMSSEYSGLGSEKYPFHGVFHGNGMSVTMVDKVGDDLISEVGYGFINVANGCAVYSLTVNYGTVSLSTEQLNASASLTSGPVDTELATGLPHFGGVVARIVGGDNLIDTVNVTAVTVNPGATHTVCGGYVGIISGGGVLFKDLSATDGVFNASKSHLYHNNYAGRVINGYALAIDGKVYDNSKVFKLDAEESVRADFVIPTETYADHSTGFADNTFTIENAKDLLFLSFGMNSGTFAGENGYGYGQTSVSRCGNYENVGNTSYTTDIANGRYIDDSNKVGVCAKYFGINSATDLRNTALTINLSGTDYDLSGYGNAMRGMSGTYEKTPKYNIVSFAGTNGTANIKVEMDMPHYAVLNSDNDYDNEVDCIWSYGLFGQLKSGSVFRAENINVSGNVSVRLMYSGGTDNKSVEKDKYTGSSIKDSCTVGAILGRADASFTMGNVSLADITVASPDITGGFLGDSSSGTVTVEGDNSADNATIKGKRHSGGVVGRIYSGTAEISNVTIENSVIETHVANPKTNNDFKSGTGGIIGGIDDYSTGASLSNCTIRKTAIVFFSNIKGISNNVGSGGLVGWTIKPLTAASSTVDGCVIFSLSELAKTNFPNGSFLYNVAADNVNDLSILSQDIKDNLAYQGEKRNSLEILTYLLSMNQDNKLSDWSIGAAGGFVGIAFTNLEFSDCVVTSSSAPSVFAALNGASGMIGEMRYVKTHTVQNVTMNNCRVLSENHDTYIIGGTRGSGVISYRDSSGSAKCNLDNIQIVGTEAHPIRIIQNVYASTNAAGLFAEINTATVTVNNCRVSYCIISAAKAGGVYATYNRKCDFTLNNAHVSNNLIYSTQGNYSGGLFGDVSEVGCSIKVNGAYIGQNYILGNNGSGAGAISGRLMSPLSAKYVILEDNIIRRVTTRKASYIPIKNPVNSYNYTFATYSLEGWEAANQLINTTDFYNTALIAANNSANLNATAVSLSCLDSDVGTTQQKNVSSDTGTTSVVYVAYGAGKVYEFADGYSDKTPQQIAIEKMSGEFTVDGNPNTVYCGDPITTVADSDEKTSARIGSLKWWPYQDTYFDNISISDLHTVKNSVTVNGNLPLLCIGENTDDTMKCYLNVITGHGFSDVVEKKLVNINILSNRYAVNAEGELTNTGEEGSVVYRNGEFHTGVYDNLEEDTGTVTVLTVTFSEKGGSDVYTMHIPIYYHRSVNMKTFVVPLEGEQFHLPSFFGNNAQANNPSVNSLVLSTSFGNPFTLYIEYDYNDMAMNLDNLDNFYKRIEMIRENGASSNDAFIESGTSFILIDLNSTDAIGYKYYTLTLTENKRFIDFNDFTPLDYLEYVPLKDLESIGHLLQNRVCADMGGEGNDCVYAERYLMTVYPVKKDVTMAYNMKAVIDQEQRNQQNIVVKSLKDVFAQVSVWAAPTVQPIGTSLSSKPFSNMDDETISMQIDTTITFPDGYVSSLLSQGRGVYETHIYRLQDENGKYVELPTGTKVTLETEYGKMNYTVGSPESQVRFLVSANGTPKNILENMTNDLIEKQHTVTLDFSDVSDLTFLTVFSGHGRQFTLVDSLYLSGNKDLLGDVFYDASAKFTIKIEDAIQFTVTPDDNRYLGINLNTNAQQDETNNGIVKFTANAGFEGFGGKKTFEKAKISFKVSKKVYNTDRYEYVDLTDDEAAIWQIWYDGRQLTNAQLENIKINDNQELSEKFELRVIKDSDKLQKTNYKLTAYLEATAKEDSSVVPAFDYFVFLVCDINSEPPK